MAIHLHTARDVRRIQVYADAETKRRIELAAAKHDLPVTSYCLEAIMQQLEDDDVLEQEHIEIAVRPTDQIVDAQLIAQMRVLRDKVEARRGGKLITDDMVDQVRSERDEELHE
ncbi:MAG: hypothetical protein M3014_08095 [Chloroflexota bacterium]|nr:hypothetical protein [Chloroflexota bacterium]